MPITSAVWRHSRTEDHSRFERGKFYRGRDLLRYQLVEISVTASVSMSVHLEQ
jgi:hypothetical protein